MEYHPDHLFFISCKVQFVLNEPYKWFIAIKSTDSWFRFQLLSQSLSLRWFKLGCCFFLFVCLGFSFGGGVPFLITDYLREPESNDLIIWKISPYSEIE